MDTKNLAESKRKTVSNEYQNHVEQHLTGSRLNTQTKQESVTTSGSTSASVMTESTMARMKRQGALNGLAQKESDGGKKVDVMKAAADQMAKKRAVAAASSMVKVGTRKRGKGGVIREGETLVQARRKMKKQTSRKLGVLYQEHTGKNIRSEYSRWMTAERWRELNQGKFNRVKNGLENGGNHNFRSNVYRGMKYIDKGINKKTTIYDQAKINKNGEFVKTGKKVIRTHRVILPDKKEVISASKYRKIYNPTFKDKTLGDSQKLFKEGSKLGLDGALKKSKQKMEEEGGTGGRTMSMMISAPLKTKEVISTAKGVKHGVEFAGKATWNTGKFAVQGTKVLAQGTYAGGKLALQGARTLKRDGLRGAAKAAKKVSQEALQVAVAAAQKASRIAVKAAAEFVKKMAMSMLPAAAAIFFMFIILLAIVSALGASAGNQTEVIAIADSNSVLVAQDYLEDLVEEWEKNLEEVIEDYIEKDDCPYENNDTVIVEISCMEEPATVQSEYLALYCLLCAKNELQVNNLGLKKGNKKDSSMPDADTLKAQLAEWFAYLNPSEEEWGVEQEVKDCTECTEEPHTYTITTLSITLRTVTELVASAGLTEEELLTFNSLYGDMMTMLSDDDVKWTNHHTYQCSPYDVVSEEAWREAYKSSPVLSCTREEFVNMAVSQSFSYEYGSKNPASGALDCSGYTQYVYSLYGFDIGGGTDQQWMNTRAVSGKDARAGDLVFKQSPTGNGINHVGIYLGDYADARFNHCASSTGTVTNNYQGFVIYRRPLVRFANDVH